MLQAAGYFAEDQNLEGLPIWYRLTKAVLLKVTVRQTKLLLDLCSNSKII